jgi:hypothetical protein
MSLIQTLMPWRKVAIVPIASLEMRAMLHYSVSDWKFDEGTVAGLGEGSVIDCHEALPKIVAQYPAHLMREAVRPIYFNADGSIKEDAKPVHVRFTMAAGEVKSKQALLERLRLKSRGQYDEAARSIFAEHIYQTIAYDQRHFTSRNSKALRHTITLGTQVTKPEKLRAGFPHRDMMHGDYSRIYLATPFAPMTQVSLDDHWGNASAGLLPATNRDIVLMDGQTLHSSAPLPPHMKAGCSLLMHITAEYY